MTNLEAAFNVFSAFPEGLTRFEFVELLDTPEAKRNSSAQLSQFVKEGLAIKDGSRFNPATGQMSSVYMPTGAPFSERVLEARTSSRRRKRSTLDELKNLRKEVEELRKWKCAAISRFPELAIDPIILAARKRVAAILRSEGCAAKAELIEAGDLDDGDTMRVVRALLEDAADA